LMKDIQSPHNLLTKKQLKKSKEKRKTFKI
jgi:hypothetical protein